MVQDGSFGFYGLYNIPVAPACGNAPLGPIAQSMQAQFADDVWWNGDTYGGRVIRVMLWTPAMSNLCGSAWVSARMLLSSDASVCAMSAACNCWVAPQLTYMVRPM